MRREKLGEKLVEKMARTARQISKTTGIGKWWGCTWGFCTQNTWSMEFRRLSLVA